MDEPSEEHEPEERGEDELNNRHDQPALDQLAQARDKETAQSRDHISGGTLACHGKTLPRLTRRDKLFFPNANSVAVARKPAIGNI